MWTVRQAPNSRRERTVARQHVPGSKKTTKNIKIHQNALDLLLDPSLKIVTFEVFSIFLIQAHDALQLLVLCDYYELCGLSQHFSITMHVLETI